MCARHAKFSLFLVHLAKRKWKTVNQTATTVYYIENQERLTFCKIICCLAFTYVRHKKFMTDRVILQHTTVWLFETISLCTEFCENTIFESVTAIEASRSIFRSTIVLFILCSTLIYSTSLPPCAKDEYMLMPVVVVA